MVLLLALAGSAAGLDADGATTLIVRFSGSARPDYALTPATVSGDAEILPEGALRITRFTHLAIDVGEGTLRGSEGAVELRLRPEWDALPETGVPILVIGRRVEDRRDLEPELVLTGDGSLAARGFGAFAAETKPIRWERGRWVRIGVSWDEDGVVLTLEGTEAARSALAGSGDWEALQVTLGGVEASIDDLHFSDRARGAGREPVVRPGVPAGGAAIRGRIGRPSPESPPIVLSPKPCHLDPDAVPAFAPAGAILLAAARGETESATFLLTATVPLSGVRVTVDLPGIAVEAFVTCPQYAPRTGAAIGPAPTDSLLRPLVPFDLAAGEGLEVWLSLSVPAEAEAGTRRGSVTVFAGDLRAALPIEIEVWLFELPSPPVKSLAAFIDPADRLVEPDRLAADLRALRAAGVTALALGRGVEFDAETGAADASVLDRVLGALEAAGFAGPVVVPGGSDATEREATLVEAVAKAHPALATRFRTVRFIPPFSSGLPLGFEYWLDARTARREFGILSGVLLWASPFTAVLGTSGGGGRSASSECLREGHDNCRFLGLLEDLAASKAAEWPEAAARAREFLSGVRARVRQPGLLDSGEVDRIRREAAERVIGLTLPGSLGITVRGADGAPLPFVLVSAMGSSGAPVAKLYDYRVDLDGEGRGAVAGVPSGRYSVRLHREREFRAEEGFDEVWLGAVEVRPGERAVIEAILAPGGRLRVSNPEEGRLRLLDAEGRPVSTTFWRGEAGGWATDGYRLTPPFTSCVLPPGRYRVELLRARRPVAAGEVEVAGGAVTDLSLRSLPHR